MRSVRFRWLRFGPLEASVLLGFGLTALVLAAPWSQGRDRVAREEAAQAAAEGVLVAQREFRRRGLRDLDGDGTFEFGTAKELEAAGLAPPAPSGYLVDVLLPSQVERDGRRTLVAQPGDPTESGKTFVVVVRPRSRDDGLRSFYRDASGALYVAEGVVDAEAFPQPPVPAATLDGDEDSTNPGPFWRAVVRPDAALAAVEDLAKAQGEFRARRLRDRDGDEAFEFGTLSELVAAGLARRDAAAGYALHVLLPKGAAASDGRRELVAEAGDAAESARFFAVVARPTSTAGGCPSYYRDADGGLFVAEGGFGARAKAPPLPTTSLVGDEARSGAAFPWVRARASPRPADPRKPGDAKPRD